MALTTDEQDWVAFNPGFDHGDVTVRKSNIDGVFTADKIALLSKEELLGTEVRTANLGGQIGEESFDWRAADTGGADVRMANCKGQLGSESFDWGATDPNARGADVRRANLKGTTIGESTFAGLGVLRAGASSAGGARGGGARGGGAPIHKTVPTDDDVGKVDDADVEAAGGGGPVRAPNVRGQIGDKEFTRLLRTERTPLNAVQRCWRGAVFVVPVVPLALVYPVASAVPSEFGLPAIVALVLVLAALGCAWCLSKKVLMVKLGTLAFVEFAENGTTHVLQAGLHFRPGLFAKVQVFDAKEDQMKFGTTSFVRVRPGLLGLGTENGKPVLLLPGQVRRAPSSRPRPLATPPL